MTSEHNRSDRSGELDRVDDVEVPSPLTPDTGETADVNPGREQSEIARETTNDKDEDGLPDGPAKFRVPS